MALSYAEVAEILKVIDASDMDELVLELGETRLVVRRRGAGGAQVSEAPRGAAPEAAPPVAAPAPRAAAARAAAPAGAEPPEPGAVAVEAPSVGRAYRRPSPDEPPYVEAGQRVEAGQTLCLVEVMKLFTAIEAPAAGTVIAFAFEDGGAVEYGTPLVWIRPG